jgi:hypothetical protein
VALFAVVLHHCPGSDFFGALAIAAARLGLFFNVFIHPLLFGPDSAKMFLARHGSLLFLMMIVVEIAVAIVVPLVTMFNAAVGAFPVTFVEELAVVSRTIPTRANIWRAAPVSVMPNVTARYRIPISSDPCVIGPWACRYGIDSGRRGWADRDSNRHGAKHHSCG